MKNSKMIFFRFFFNYILYFYAIKKEINIKYGENKFFMALGILLQV